MSRCATDLKNRIATIASRQVVSYVYQCRAIVAGSHMSAVGHSRPSYLASVPNSVAIRRKRPKWYNATNDAKYKKQTLYSWFDKMKEIAN